MASHQSSVAEDSRRITRRSAAMRRKADGPTNPESGHKKPKQTRAKCHRSRRCPSNDGRAVTKRFFLKITRIPGIVIKFKRNGVRVGEMKVAGKYKFTSRVVVSTT